MKIDDFEVIDRCLYWESEDTLIVGDLHLGYEEILMKRGMSIPRRQLEETLTIFKKIFKKTGKVKQVLILGDVKHHFGGILDQEFRDFDQIVSFLKRNLKENGKIIITKGNHDTILEPVTKNYLEVELVDYFEKKGFLFFHGDAKSMKKVYEIIKSKKIKQIIVGHFHPAYLLKDKQEIKKEKYKCFLYGKSKSYGKKVIFVPSFFPLIEGSDILRELEIYEIGMQIVAIDENGELYHFKKI